MLLCAPVGVKLLDDLGVVERRFIVPLQPRVKVDGVMTLLDNS